jgi:hypothetical protein
LRKCFLKKNPPCGEGCFPKNCFQKPLFQTETLQKPQQGYSLIGEYHLKVIFGLTFPQEEKEQYEGTDKFLLIQPFAYDEHCIVS